MTVGIDFHSMEKNKSINTMEVNDTINCLVTNILKYIFFSSIKERNSQVCNNLRVSKYDSIFILDEYPFQSHEIIKHFWAVCVMHMMEDIVSIYIYIYTGESHITGRCLYRSVIGLLWSCPLLSLTIIAQSLSGSYCRTWTNYKSNNSSTQTSSLPITYESKWWNQRAAY